MTVREMLSRMDSNEISKWKVYFKIQKEEFEGKKTRQQIENELHKKVK